eukprot:scaffold3412_cov171-Ochromonas_danica.AAC.9
MNKTFQSVIAAHVRAPVLTHQQEVKRLYRRWAENREVFVAEATLIRAEFNANKSHGEDSGLTKRLIREARERLDARRHPDPYIVAYMPGGTLFMRNSPPPLSVVYPDGIPEGVSQRLVNIDMSPVPEGEEFGSTVFVDSVNKTYYIDK